MSDWTDVARTDELAPGDYRVVDIDDALIAVFNIDGEYYAIEDVCTHDYETLTGGCIEGDEIVCPRHGARFNIKTGEALTPPAYEPVATLPVRVENGMVQVRDDRWD
ncbi:MAG: Rieske 2Fe-2S domain-containing protein [Gammaproteobacteria bacterium]|nr:Rieske 2Fe-2S domain-containing protein [Gammaproteobacteria bacterium]NIM73454.1 Rieske 2Fe-2S domain-containing protein [Gammaproteobacteria bacterium]NIN39863.1 Rieske 2Fe-2S domain-containing protein [Gammaproteobacteria bacterium]NIO25263.1 Rieske 2Fe-2S domain-containing protein [Gammaproteobacteria bacterium]NIO65890.1 Rieske 2Fe-2S domain-containing protein [Gammaproteobacteria bacterium]